MLNQKIQNPNPDELMIEVDLCYELDPYELKLDEMIEAEPEPEMIEGLPASDALTPADRYLELFEHVQSAKIFPDSKTFPDCAPKMDPLDILIRYRKVRRHRDFDLRKFVENHFWLPEVYSSEYVSDPQNSLKEHIDQLWPVLTREPIVSLRLIAHRRPDGAARIRSTVFHNALKSAPDKEAMSPPANLILYINTA